MGLEERNVVGVFRDEVAASAAVQQLERRGFPPDRVSIVAENVRQSREVVGSRSPQGLLVGGVFGLLVFGVFVGLGGEVMRTNPVAIALGLVGFVVAGAAIGALAGRGKVFEARRAERYETLVDAGEALVTVHCENGQFDRARAALTEAGAITVREEKTPERT